MPFPFIPNGFTSPLPVETGQAPDTVLGRLTADAAITDFYYTKVIERTIPGVGSGNIRESWTIQILESNDENARVLFDQTVDMGITTFSAGGMSTWFFVQDHGMSVGKFKTRIVDGTPVKQVIENVPGQNAATGADVPDHVYLSALKQQSIRATLPALPAGASKFTLWASGSSDGAAVKIGEGVAGEIFTVEAAAVGLSDPTKIWLWCEAVFSNKSTFSPKVRDAFMELDGQTQLAGYEGWKHIGGPITKPTVFSESSLATDDNGTSFQIFSGRISASWQSQVYKCALPPNAIVKVEHDGWVSATVINNRFTYAFGFAYGNDAMLFAPQTQETWTLYRGKSQSGTESRAGASAVQCARTLKVASFPLMPNYDGGLRFKDNNKGISRSWLFQNRTWIYAFIQSGSDLYGCYSNTKGVEWEEGVNIFSGVQVMGMTANDDNSIIWMFGNRGGQPVRAVLKLTRQVPAENTATDGQTENVQMLWRVTTLEDIQTQDMEEVPAWFNQPLGVTRPHGHDGVAFVWFKSGQNIACWRTEDYFRIWRKIDIINE